MQKKSQFSKLFLTIGTVMLMLTMSIVTFNFFKDSRFLEKPVMAAVNGDITEPAGSQADNSDDYKTIKFDKKTSEDQTKQENKDSSQKKATDVNNPVNTGKIRVEILNYSGFEGLGEKLAKSLETSGFEVSYTEMKQEIQGNTLIIERNDRIAGPEVRKVIGAWQIVKWPDDKSKYDVTVKLGADFNP